MSFKIVKTYENNKDKLFAVPAVWEDKNILKWPRKNEAKHLKNESIPEDDWKQLRCVVKRRNIPSYETTEYVLKEMLNHTDTEDDSHTSIKPISEKPLRELNLNILADEIVCPAASSSNNVLVEMPTASGSNIITSEMPAATSVGMDNVYEYHILQDNQSTTNQHQCYTNFGQNLEILNAILSNQTTILNELKSIKTVQNIMIQKVSLFSIQMEDAVSQITQATENNSQVTDLIESRSTQNNTFYVKPVDNLQQLNELEQQLSESSVREKMKNTYSVLCNGGKGIDCAYSLADILFSRDFLCQCTWSGGSRGSNTKVAWKSFKHILSFFWEMVHSWDKTYTVNENEKFFKNILKNSKKRKMAKNQRASTSRKRSKLSKAENANEYEISDEDDMSYESNDDSIIKENLVTEKKKQEKDQETGKESDIGKETSLTENNPEDICQETEKKRDIAEVNTAHSNNSSNDKESDMNDENVKTDKNEEFYAISKEIEGEQNYDKEITIDTMIVTNSEKNKENAHKDNSNEPSTSFNDNFQSEKNMPKKKIVRLSKKTREKHRLLNIKKNRPITHKNVSGKTG